MKDESCTRVSVLPGGLSPVETNHTMKFRTTLFAAIALSLLVTTSSFALASLQVTSAPAPPSPQEEVNHSNQTTLPASILAAARLGPVARHGR